MPLCGVVFPGVGVGSPGGVGGVEAWSVSAEEVEVVALVASAERVDVAALVASAERVDVAVLVASVERVDVAALVASAERVDVAALVLPSPAMALAAGVCLSHSQSGVQFLAGWGPLLAAGEVYRLAVDGADPNWDVAPPLV